MTALQTTPQEQSPTVLVQRIGAGDSEAEGILVTKYQRSILEMLRHRTQDWELAQDLFQDTLVIVLRRLRSEGLEQPEKLAAFIHRTAHNLVIAHFRKEGRRNTHTDTEQVEVRADDAPTELESILEQERASMVRELLSELSVARDREVLQRYYVWGEEKNIVCDALELDSDQFDRVVSRARQRFRALVDKRMGEVT